MNDHALLLVEDNPDDVFIMRRALEKAAIDLPLFLANDGKEALDYLTGKGPFGDRSKFPMPSLIFLDLKLPYLNGFEVLESIRENPALQQLDVVILTSSGEERDQRRAAQLGVSAYLIKPPKPHMLHQALQLICDDIPEQRPA